MSQPISQLNPMIKSLVIVVDNVLCSTTRNGENIQTNDYMTLDKQEETEEDQRISICDNSSCDALDSFAKEGCCGLLVREKTVEGMEATENAEIGHGLLVDIVGRSVSLEDDGVETLASRFQGVNAMLLRRIGSPSTVDSAFGVCDLMPQDITEKQLAEKVSRILNIPCVEGNTDPCKQGNPCETVNPTGDHISKEHTEASCTEIPDMLLINLNTNVDVGNDQERCHAFESARSAVVYLNNLLKFLDEIPGFKETVLVSLVLGANRTYPIEALVRYVQQKSQRAILKTDKNSNTVCRPFQSFQFKGLNRVEVDPNSCSIVIHRLTGAVRCDRVKRLDINAIIRQAGGGCILAERMMYEIAFKIGKAPKYGD